MHENELNRETATKIRASSPSWKNQVLQCVDKWSYWTAVLVGVGVFLVVRTPPSEGLWIVFYAFGYVACLTVSVILHETGHVLAALAAGVRPLKVVIGHGEQLGCWLIGAIPWVFYAKPTSGYVLPGCPGGQFVRLRMMITVIGGPAINALLFAGTAALMWFSLERRERPNIGDMTSAWLFLFLAANGIVLWMSIVPADRAVGGTKASKPNDGRLLLDLFRQQDSFAHYQSTAELWELLRKAHEQLKPNSSASNSHLSPAAMDDNSLYWEHLFNGIPKCEVAHVVHYALGKFSVSPELRNRLMDYFATWVLFTDCAEYLDQADRYSEELVYNQPQSWSIKGTRGAVLVEKGEIQAGMRMLVEVMEHDPSYYDRAISACFLALGELKQKNFTEARQWLNKAQALDPHCIALSRIELLLRKAVLDACQRKGAGSNT